MIMQTNNKLLPLKAVLFCLFISTGKAHSEEVNRYHKVIANSNIVVFSLIHVITKRDGTTEEIYVFHIGQGYISSDSYLITSGKKAMEIKKHLTPINIPDKSEDLFINLTPVIKLFSPSHPEGLGYIRSLDDKLSSSTWSNTDTIRIPVTRSSPIEKLPHVELSPEEVVNYRQHIYRTLISKPKYKKKGNHKFALLKFHNEKSDTPCNNFRCDNTSANDKLSFKPVFAVDEMNQNLILYGHTQHCSEQSLCKITKIVPDNEKIPEPEIQSIQQQPLASEERKYSSLYAIPAIALIWTSLVAVYVILHHFGFDWLTE